MAQKTVGRITDLDRQDAGEALQRINTHAGGTNVSPLVNRSARTDHEIAEALDALQNVMTELLQAIRQLTDQLSMEQWDRRYGRKTDTMGKLPWNARPTSPLGQEPLDPNN